MFKLGLSKLWIGQIDLSSWMYQTKFDSINAELPVRKSRPRHLSTISANYSLFCLLFSIKDSRLFTHTVGYVQLFDVTSGHIMRYSDRLVWLVNDYYTTSKFLFLCTFTSSNCIIMWDFHRCDHRCRLWLLSICLLNCDSLFLLLLCLMFFSSQEIWVSWWVFN